MTETVFKPLSFFITGEQANRDLGSEEDLRNLGESVRHRQIGSVGSDPGGHVIYGFRRVHAARLVGLEGLLVTIYSETLTKAELDLMNWSENWHRRDLSAFETFLAFEGFRRDYPDWSGKQLAAYLKVEAAQLTKYLSPSRCIQAWRDALQRDEVGISDCYAASRASEEQQVQMLAIKRGGASRDELFRSVRRAKPQTGEPVARTARIAIPLPSGSCVAISGEDLSLADVIEELSQCLQAARAAQRQDLDVKTWRAIMRDKSQAADGS